MPRSLESRVVTTGLTALGLTTAWFAAFKLAMWRSEVVHEEKASIHRLFFDKWTVKFPQEAFNLVDFLTTTFLIVGGVAALGVAFWMTERLRSGATRSPEDTKHVRGFFRIAGLGFIWLGLDEIFLIHEFASANLLVHDALFLGFYGIVGLVACLAYWRVLVEKRIALSMLLIGAVFHGTTLALDVIQDKVTVWVPEEPFEMIAAGFYAIGMATYFAGYLSHTALMDRVEAFEKKEKAKVARQMRFEQKHRREQRAMHAQSLPPSAIEPLPAGFGTHTAPIPKAPKRQALPGSVAPSPSLPSDPTWAR